MSDRLQSTIEKHANYEDTPSQITKINCSHLIQIFGVCCTNSMINRLIYNINTRLLFSIEFQKNLKYFFVKLIKKL